MAALESLPTWVSLFEEARKIESVFAEDDYQDLNRKFIDLQARVTLVGTITDEENEAFEQIIKSYYRRAIANRYQALRSSITTRKTKGETFSGQLKRLERIRSSSENDCDIAEMRDLFLDTVEIGELVNEKIEIERHQVRQQWKFALIGAGLGFLIGVLTTVGFRMLFGW